MRSSISLRMLEKTVFRNASSFDTETSYGGSALVQWSASKTLRLSLLGEGERLRDAGALGSYWSISAGLQYLFGLE